MGAFFLKFRDRIPVKVYFMVRVLGSGRKFGEGSIDR